MKEQKKTKIIATLGPASNSPETIKALMEAGVNIFRFNTKQADPAWHIENIKKTHSISQEIGIPVGIFVDLQGPEIRIETKDKQDIPVEPGDKIIFSLTLLDNNRAVNVPNKAFFKAINKNDIFSIDDGSIELKAIKKEGEEKIIAKVIDGGIIKHRKGLNAPGKSLDLSPLIKRDMEILDIVKNLPIDFIGLSFSRSKADINLLRNEMKNRKIFAQIIAKIEDEESIKNIDEIIESADVIMVARGDLGIEVPFERIAYYQRDIINKCRIAKKPVIVATQMLESMTNNPRPTRAEATDVANAIFNGTDAVMLSGETAIGKYPVKTVVAMARIAQFNEQKTFFWNQHKIVPPKTTTELIVRAATSMAEEKQDMEIDAFIVFTESGKTAQALSNLRPISPIIAVTDKQKTIGALTIHYGITTLYKVSTDHKDDKFEIIEELKQKGIIKTGQNVIIVYGRHADMPEITNSIMLVKVN